MWEKSFLDRGNTQGKDPETGASFEDTFGEGRAMWLEQGELGK